MVFSPFLVLINLSHLAERIKKITTERKGFTQTQILTSKSGLPAVLRNLCFLSNLTGSCDF